MSSLKSTSDFLYLSLNDSKKNAEQNISVNHGLNFIDFPNETERFLKYISTKVASPDETPRRLKDCSSNVDEYFDYLESHPGLIDFINYVFDEQSRNYFDKTSGRTKNPKIMWTQEEIKELSSSLTNMTLNDAKLILDDINYKLKNCTESTNFDLIFYLRFQVLQSLSLNVMAHRDYMKISNVEMTQAELKTEEPKTDVSSQDKITLLDKRCYLSRNVEFSFDTHMGRSLKATASVLPGELLFKDYPMFVLETSINFKSCCYHCSRRIPAPIPTSNCSLHSYCSPTCEQQCSFVHDLICTYTYVYSGLEIFLPFGSKNNMSLALKIIVSQPLSFFLEHGDAFLEEITPEDYIDTNFAHDFFKDYLRLFRLLGHEKNRVLSEYLDYATMALMGLEILVRSHYIDETRNTPRNRRLFTKLLFKLLNILPINVISFTQAHHGSRHGLYKLAHFINHSCTSNTIVIYDDLFGMSIYATEEIKAGSQITISYGNVRWESMTLEDRQFYLTTRSKFNCLCPACRQSWRIDQIVSQQMNSIHPCKVFCPKCRSIHDTTVGSKKCLSCGHLLKIDNIRRKIEVSVLKMKKESHILSSMIKSSQILNSLIPQPNPWSHQVRTAIEKIIFLNATKKI